MIEFGLLPGVEAVGSVVGALRTAGKSRSLKRAWNATMTAGHIGQVSGYASWANRKGDPMADWLARRMG